MAKKSSSVGRKLADTAARKGPNPSERIKGAWHPGTPPRHQGDFGVGPLPIMRVIEGAGAHPTREK